MASTLREFVIALDKPTVDFWREALSNLRQLHNDIWNGVRFFLTVNGIVIAGFAALLRSPDHDYVQAGMLLLLLATGIFLTIQARSILVRHRGYYLGMLIRKTLIEKQLGFYDFLLSEDLEDPRIDLSFPWQVDHQFLSEFSRDIAKWHSEQEKRPGLITTTLFRIYDVTLGLYAVLGLGVAALLYVGYFCK
jgi:hypothetical protein